MEWDVLYGQDTPPSFEDIGAYIGSDLWPALCGYMETAYAMPPMIEYSKCSGARGWNVKYKKGSRSLCTLYPHKQSYTCLVCIGAKEAPEAELALSSRTDYVRELYQKTKPFNGTRWLMIDVTSAAILEDVKALIGTRAKARR